MSLLKTNEIQNYNGSSLTLTASTVSTSAQLNTGGNISVTGSLNVSDDSTTRTNLGLGTIATQDSDSIAVTGGSVTGTEIDLKSSGTTIYKSDGTTGVLSESGGVVTLTADEANVGSNALVVDSSGNVGIGTSSPNPYRTLTVDGGAIIYDELFVSLPSANTPRSTFVGTPANVTSSVNMFKVGAASNDNIINNVQSGISLGEGYTGMYAYDNGGSADTGMAFFAGSNITVSEVFSITKGGLVVNEQSANIDFRVESDTNTHALFVDAGNDRVNIGTSTDYGAKLNIFTGNSFSVDYDAITVKNSGENGCNINFDNAFGTMVQIKGTKRGSGGAANEGRIEIRTAVNATLTGGVYIENGGTSWAGISDENKKTDLVAIENGAEKVKTLRAVTGRYKTDPEDRRRAFLIAQDVQKVLPEAVSETEDDGETSLLLYYTDTIPLLTAALKEAIARIESLETHIAALENT